MRGTVLVGFRRATPAAVERRIVASIDARDLRVIGVGTHVLRLRSGWTVPGAIASLRRYRSVRYALADYIGQLSAAPVVPNDTYFGLQWGSENFGQSIPSQDGGTEALGPARAGTPGADDRAPWAWRVTTGSRSIVVGVADTGVDYSHPDLAANIWANPGGVGGCPAGTHGYNVNSDTCDPSDKDATLSSGTGYGGHGTHVAGIIGAVGDNGVGIAGLNWTTSILGVSWAGTDGDQSIDKLIEALGWLDQAKHSGVNVRVVNDSITFANTPYYPPLVDEINQLGKDNILLVTAAGNHGLDNDVPVNAIYPCDYDLANEICATATDNADQLPSWADYGPATVDLGAPGESIYSTLRDQPYGYLSGGSMAAAEVSGTAALVLSVQPNMSVTALKADILSSVDKLPALQGMVRTGGRLNVCRAVPGCNTDPFVQTSPAQRLVPTSALLRGAVDPNGSATTASFQYSQSSALRSAHVVPGAGLSVGSDESLHQVSATTAPLQPNTRYYFRLTAANANSPSGAGTGATLSFRTPYTYAVGVPSGQSIRSLLSSGLKVRAGCDARCSVRVELFLLSSVRHRPRALPLGGIAQSVGADRVRVVLVKPERSTLKAVSGRASTFALRIWLTPVGSGRSVKRTVFFTLLRSRGGRELRIAATVS